jgi:enoyl-CoA hydratase/carnithine racemase
VLPADMLVEQAIAQATRLAALPRGALAASRALIRGDQAQVEAALEAEAKAFDAQLRSPESQERLAAFLSRSKPASSA